MTDRFKLKANFNCEKHPQDDFRGNKPACKFCLVENFWRMEIADEVAAIFDEIQPDLKDEFKSFVQTISWVIRNDIKLGLHRK